MLDRAVSCGSFIGFLLIVLLLLIVFFSTRLIVFFPSFLFTELFVFVFIGTFAGIFVSFCLIDDFLSAKEKKKFLKKLEKDMLKGICIGNDNGYRLITFKAGDLKNMVEYIGINGLTTQIKTQILPILKNGDRILNTNLKELGIELE